MGIDAERAFGCGLYTAEWCISAHGFIFGASIQVLSVLDELGGEDE